jgi:hypothetical protein
MNFLESLKLFLLGLIILSSKSEGKTLLFQSSTSAMRSMNEWETDNNHHPFDTNKSTQVYLTAIQFAGGRLRMSYEIRGFYWHRSVGVVGGFTPKKVIIPKGYDIQVPKWLLKPLKLPKNPHRYLNQYLGRC